MVQVQEVRFCYKKGCRQGRVLCYLSSPMCRAKPSNVSGLTFAVFCIACACLSEKTILRHCTSLQVWCACGTACECCFVERLCKQDFGLCKPSNPSKLAS